MSKEESLVRFDKMIEQEIIFNQQKFTDDKDENSYEALLALILLWVKQGKKLSFIKKRIKAFRISERLLINLRKGLEVQSQIITNSRKLLDIDKVVYDGLTTKEIIKAHKANVINRTIRFANSIENANKSDYRNVFDNEINRYKRSVNNIYKTVASSERDTYEAEVDKEPIRKNVVKGWMSVAVLDNRTSPVCIGLHSRFYSRKTYKTRFDIPNKPPRHPRCRSILYTVYTFENENDFVDETLTKFFKRNRTAGKTIMGENKFRLYENNKIAPANFVDVVGKRFFTNEEIINRFKFDSEKALRGVSHLKEAKILSQKATENIPKNLAKNRK